MGKEYSTSVLDRANRHLVIEQIEGGGHIAVVAYYISEERQGAQNPGDDKDDWKEAEAVVLEEYAKKIARKDKLAQRRRNEAPL
jgi:hypothetical protein